MARPLAWPLKVRVTLRVIYSPVVGVGLGEAQGLEGEQGLGDKQGLGVGRELGGKQGLGCEQWLGV